MKVILALAMGGRADPAILAHAAAAGRDGAHIDVCHVRRDPRDTIPVIGEGLSPEIMERMIAEGEEENARRAAVARSAFDGWREAAGIARRESPSVSDGLTTRWIESVGRPEEVAAVAGRLADLVVAARPAAGRGEDQRLVEAVLFGSGRPALLVPPDQPVAGGGGAIFWNGSAEAARAVAAALPMLRRAERVHIMEVDEKLGPEAAQAGLPDYLAWHGIAAETTRLEADYREPGEALLAEALRVGARLIVMGAYTHSRMRQLILGGVTSHLLTACPVPVMLAH
ncbi:MAG: universal stress protein [Alphaproteobacteria bacterium]